MGDAPVVDRREVERIARLAHITLDEEEKTALATDLRAVLEYARKLEELDVAGIEPPTHTVEAQSSWRDDEVEQSLSGESALANAPQHSTGGFAVPRVRE